MRPATYSPTAGPCLKPWPEPPPDRKSTRLNSSHPSISYAVFCLNHPATTEIYTLSLHDALPISHSPLSPKRARFTFPLPNRPALNGRLWRQCEPRLRPSAVQNASGDVLPDCGPVFKAVA